MVVEINLMQLYNAPVASAQLIGNLGVILYDVIYNKNIKTAFRLNQGPSGQMEKKVLESI